MTSKALAWAFGASPGMFVTCGIGYSQIVDWEAPSQADSGPGGAAQPAGVPPESNRDAADHGDMRSAEAADAEDVAKGWEFTSRQVAGAQPGSEQHPGWRLVARQESTRRPAAQEEASHEPAGREPHREEPTSRERSAQEPAGHEPASRDPDREPHGEEPTGQEQPDQPRARHSAGRAARARPNGTLRRFPRPHLTLPRLRSSRPRRAGPPLPSSPVGSRPATPRSGAARPGGAPSGQAQAGAAAAAPPQTGSAPTAPQHAGSAPTAPQHAGSAPTAPQQADRAAAGRPEPWQPPGQEPQTQPQAGRALLTKPLISLRLPADPQVRIRVIRAVVTVAIFIVFALWSSWRLGLTAAALYAAIDIIFRSKTAAVVSPDIMVTAAQRSTSRRLKVLQPAGYMTLNTRRIPGAKRADSIIDHVVVGPAGVFVLDSERWDRRLPIRTIGGKLYHGPRSQEERLEHARWEAQQAAALIGAELGRQIKVHPAMVIYGPRIPWVMSRLGGVDVFDGGRVSAYFRRSSKATVGRQLNASQIGRLYAAAAHALPPAE